MINILPLRPVLKHGPRSLTIEQEFVKIKDNLEEKSKKLNRVNILCKFQVNNEDYLHF